MAQKRCNQVTGPQALPPMLVLRYLDGEPASALAREFDLNPRSVRRLLANLTAVPEGKAPMVKNSRLKNLVRGHPSDGAKLTGKALLAEIRRQNQMIIARLAILLEDPDTELSLSEIQVIQDIQGNAGALEVSLRKQLDDPTPLPPGGKELSDGNQAPAQIAGGGRETPILVLAGRSESRGPED